MDMAYLNVFKILESQVDLAEEMFALKIIKTRTLIVAFNLIGNKNA